MPFELILAKEISSFDVSLQGHLSPRGFLDACGFFEDHAVPALLGVRARVELPDHGCYRERLLRMSVALYIYNDFSI